jgi:hypothetical protein
MWLPLKKKRYLRPSSRRTAFGVCRSGASVKRVSSMPQ